MSEEDPHMLLEAIASLSYHYLSLLRVRQLGQSTRLYLVLELEVK